MGDAVDDLIFLRPFGGERHGGEALAVGEVACRHRNTVNGKVKL